MPRRQADIDIAETAGGTPYGARVLVHSGDTAASGVVGAAGRICDIAENGYSVPPRERFRLGQIWLVGDKGLVEDDADGYVECIREPLLGSGSKGKGERGKGKGGEGETRGLATCHSFVGKNGKF